jgi:hypothetical protein
MRYSRGICLLFAAGGVVAGLSACHAQVKAQADVNGAEAEAADDRKWEVPEAPAPVQEGPPAGPKPAPRVASAIAPAPAAAPGVQFIGVTHDLSLAPGAPRTVGCRCLAVAYGPPSDGKFTWQGGTPLGDQDSVAIAIATEGAVCTSLSPLPRASISAIERDGTDIVLILENIGEGRPTMHGALAVSPGPNGAIVVRTKSGTPYPAANGTGPCRIPMR